MNFANLLSEIPVLEEEPGYQSLSEVEGTAAMLPLPPVLPQSPAVLPSGDQQLPTASSSSMDEFVIPASSAIQPSAIELLSASDQSLVSSATPTGWSSNIC